MRGSECLSSTHWPVERASYALMQPRCQRQAEMSCDELHRSISTVGFGKFNLPQNVRTVTFKKEIAANFTRSNSPGRERRHKQCNFMNERPLDYGCTRMACSKLLRAIFAIRQGFLLRREKRRPTGFVAP